MLYFEDILDYLNQNKMELVSEATGNGHIEKSTNPVFRIIFLNRDFEQYMYLLKRFGDQVIVEYFDTKEGVMNVLFNYFPADCVIAHENALGLELLEDIRSSSRFSKIPFILQVDKLSIEKRSLARKLCADDIFDAEFSTGDLLDRLSYFNQRHWYIAERASRQIEKDCTKIPLWKRIFDITSCGAAILILSPVLIFVALAIRFDSKGPIIYRSKRVGAGYKIFSLLKFRTMRVDADSMVKKMASLNMYNKPSTLEDLHSFKCCSECSAKSECKKLLFLDDKEICERVYHKQKDEKAAFMKFQNDPRITRIGSFLRNTSLDELPQLFNILLGDMSLVGNRPLPLYEAEKLTTDDKILRFAGPAGLTGLWQVTKRGKGKADMSEEERSELDVTYAKEFSFAMDMKIILKTIPALFQSENV